MTLIWRFYLLDLLLFIFNWFFSQTIEHLNKLVKYLESERDLFAKQIEELTGRNQSSNESSLLYKLSCIKKLLILQFLVNSATLMSGKKEIFLFNDALNTFYLRLYGITHMVKDHLDKEKGNPLPPHGLLFPISSKGSFICIIPQTG